MSGDLPDDLLAFGHGVLQQQAFSRLLGPELTALTPGSCQLALAVRDELLQQHGFVHEGAVGHLADGALTYAGSTALAVPVVTPGFKINGVRPALGECLIARARAEAVRRAQAVCRRDVFALRDGQAKLAAPAQGSIAALGLAPGGGKPS